MTNSWKSLGGVLLAAAALAGGGCGDDGDDGSEEADEGASDAGSGGSCASLSYASFGQQFVTDYCASCHAASVKGSLRNGAPADDVFDTLAQIKADKDELKEQVQSKAMPFSTAKVFPSDAERAKFVQWIDCGPN